MTGTKETSTRTVMDIESKTVISGDTGKNIFKKVHTYLAKVKWSNVVVLSGIHILAVLGYWYLCQHDIHVATVVWASVLGLLSGLGMSVGAHRLWAHRSFKASLPLRMWLVFFQTMTMNGSCFSYARDHRTHHKYSDTEGDPKNPSRGLFYSHIGWWLLHKTDTVKQHGAKLDFSDLQQDWLLYTQHRFYVPLFLVLGVALPVAVPVLCWAEHALTAFYLCVVGRTVAVLHHLFTVNSVAHFFGARPYDFRIRPTENRLVVYVSLGEGNHNYHHTFPYDYSSSEKSAWEFFNPSTMFIDLCCALGLAHDRKKASAAVIAGTIRRKGVPAYFDPPRSLLFRICNGVVDWIIGLFVVLWPVNAILLYKYLTGQRLVVI